MFKVRSGCFETNSSSSHAMIVLKEDKPLPKMIEQEWHLHNGKLSIYHNDLLFERSPFDVLIDWYHRMCYAIASFGEESYDKIEAILYKRIDGIQEIEIWGGRDDDYYKYGYVDHQSAGLLKHFLFKNDIDLEDFIFNDRYIVIIDGDEYGVYDTMVESGLINIDLIEKCEGVYD